MQPRWESIDPRNQGIVPYDAVTSSRLEAAYQAGATTADIFLGGTKFVIDFATWRQINQQGLSRTVRRVAATPIPAAPCSGAAQRIPEMSKAVFHASLATTNKVETTVAKVHSSLHDRTLRAPEISHDELFPTLQIYEWILELLTDDAVVRKYGGSPTDVTLCNSPLSQAVPSYFANVSDGSIYRRKVLSILGLRNLVVHGPKIFNDLLAKLFSGDPSDYAQSTGLSLMRHYTGNTVDLDTIVLNASRQLKEINKMLEPSPPFPSATAFEASTACADMVKSQARHLIDSFIDTMKLNDREIRQRKLTFDPKDSIHRAVHNTDRGTRALWHYQNVGVSTFHVNVPHVEDVIGALLLAPHHLAKAFVIAMTSDVKSRDEGLAAFFEDAVSDSCFNGKWKAIEAFLDTWEKLDTIPQVLNRLQQTHQAQFNPLLSLDDDRAAEKRLMLQLVARNQLSGVDEKTKQKRFISQADVEQWIVDTN